MTFISFDLETTGFLPGVDRIVEVGAVRFVNGQPDALFCSLVNPEMSMPEASSRVNGITDDMLEGKPTIEQLLEPLAEFCGDHIMVAHNAGFDTSFLTSDIQKYESRAPRGSILDTVGISRKVFPGLANYKLGTLVQHLNIPATGFHRAQEDATYTGHLFIKCMERMTGAPGVLPPIENLIALSGKTALKFPQIIPQPKQLNFLDL